MTVRRYPALVGALVGATLGALSAAVLGLWGNTGPYDLGIVVDPLVGAVIGAFLGRRLGRADVLSTFGIGVVASVLVIPVGGFVEAAGWMGEVMGAGIYGLPDMLAFVLGSLLNPMLGVLFGDPDPAVLLLPPMGLLWSFTSYRVIHGTNPSAPAWLAA
jgi:hypothetical protein